MLSSVNKIVSMSLETKSAVVFVLVLQYPVMKVNILLNERYYKAGLPKGINVLSSTCTSFYDAFTLTDTETFTETDKMEWTYYQMTFVAESVSVSMQYDHLHAFLFKPFFIGLGLCQCERIASLISLEPPTSIEPRIFVYLNCIAML